MLLCVLPVSFSFLQFVQLRSSCRWAKLFLSLSNCLLSVLPFSPLAVPEHFHVQERLSPSFPAGTSVALKMYIMSSSHIALTVRLNCIWVLGLFLCLLFLAFWSPKPLWLSLLHLQSQGTLSWLQESSFLFLSPHVPTTEGCAFQVIKLLVPNGFLKPLGSFLLFVVCCWN